MEVKTPKKCLVRPQVYDELHRKEQFSKYDCLVEIMGRDWGDLLDVGCGTALLYEYMKSREIGFARYVCLDPHMGMLVIARQKLAETVTSLLVLGYAEVLPFRDRAFDGVLSITTWGALEDHSKAIAEAKRVAKLNGHVVFTGYPRTYTKPPSSIDPSFTLVTLCIDEFYVYSPGSATNEIADHNTSKHEQ